MCLYLQPQNQTDRMKLRFLLNFFYCFLFLCFTSCVSKKKYAGLEKSHKQIVAREAQRDLDLSKLSSNNDSLKSELVKRDSIIDSLNVKIAVFQSKKEKSKVFSSKKSSNLTKEQEYEMKSQFVYNFASYIEWPVVYNGTDFVIGVAGDKDIVNKIQETIGNKKVGGKKLKIEKYNKVTNYHVVYITSSSSNTFVTIKNESKKNKTILISDDNAFFAAGAHVSFIMDDDKIKYIINKPIIEKIGLKVSQELMRFSE